MIFPSKHLSQDRALLTIGATILQHLDQPKTISALWEELSRDGEKNPHSSVTVRYEWFVLALDLLFLIDAIKMDEGILARTIP